MEEVDMENNIMCNFPLLGTLYPNSTPRTQSKSKDFVKNIMFSII